MSAPERVRVVVKRRRGMRGHAFGHAWKVAYADFATAMMALFIVLWLITQADMRLRQQIARYFREPEAQYAAGGEAAPDQPRELIVVPGQAEQELLDERKRAIDETLERVARHNRDFRRLRDQVIVQVVDAGLSIQVLDEKREVLFDLSSARLKPPLVELLRLLGRLLGRLPNPIQIGGHTDGRPLAAESGVTSWDLAFARANGAREVLEASGLWPGQVHRVVGYANSEPLVPENPLAAENRRLSILAERIGPPPSRDCREPPLALPPDTPPTPPGR